MRFETRLTSLKTSHHFITSRQLKVYTTNMDKLCVIVND
jgi:hypothetical protein